MPDIKLLVKMVNVIFVSVWGLTVVDLVEVVAGSAGTILNIDDSVKTFMALAGAVYFVIQIPHRLRTQRIEREIQEEELEKLKRENDEADKKL